MNSNQACSAIIQKGDIIFIILDIKQTFPVL